MELTEKGRALLPDVQLHFPGILCGPFVPYPPEFVIPSIACHLGEHWSAPRQLSAPRDYDEAYYNQSSTTRPEFLAALRRIHTACSMALRADFTGNDLFATLSWGKSEEAPDYTREQLCCLADRGVAWLGSWLNWREMSPAEQLLTALGTVRIANADLGITAEAAKRPPRLFVPDCAPAIEAARFRMLLREFQRALPSRPGKLRSLLARLAPLKALPLAELREGPARELPARFPALHWPGLEERAPDSLEAETLWPDLAQVLGTRGDWAARAYDVVAVALGEVPAAPATTEPPQPGSPALNTPAPSPWGPLLTGLLELSALFEFFADCGLLNTAGELTALGGDDRQNKARKAPWAGTLQALIKSQHLDGNIAAICRALLDPAGGIQVRLNEGTLRNYSKKADTYLESANGCLRARGLLRK